MNLSKVEFIRSVDEVVGDGDTAYHRIDIDVVETNMTGMVAKAESLVSLEEEQNYMNKLFERLHKNKVTYTVTHPNTTDTLVTIDH